MGLTSVTASVTLAMADVLAPQQVAVGVSGGISIMINGIRILLEQRGDFVLVKIDLKNAYNEIDRSALLRRCRRVAATRRPARSRADPHRAAPSASPSSRSWLP